MDTTIETSSQNDDSSSECSISSTQTDIDEDTSVKSVSYSQQESVIDTQDARSPAARQELDRDVQTPALSVSNNQSSLMAGLSTPRAPLDSDNLEEEAPMDKDDLEEEPVDKDKLEEQAPRKKSFKRHPILDKCFRKTAGLDQKHPVSVCLRCEKTIKSTDTSRLLDHVRKCDKYDSRDRMSLVQSILLADDSKLTSEEVFNKRLNIMLAELIVTYNIPLRMVEGDKFLRFIHHLNERAVVVSRKDINSQYIPYLSNKVTSTFNSIMETDREFILSIEFDHWQDAARRSILAIVATLPSGLRYLVSIENVSLKGHSQEAVLSSLIEGLKGIAPSKINSIISDSGPSCKAARETLTKRSEFAHIINHRCLAHYLNLIGKKITQDDDLTALMDGANLLASIISNNQQMNALLEAEGMKKLSRSMPVRWYSTVAMLESLMEMRPKAIDLLQREENEGRNLPINLNDLGDTEFWRSIEDVLVILRPLANCIGIAETASGTLGEAMGATLDYCKGIFKLDWSYTYSNLAISSFLFYVNFDKLGEQEFGIMLAAYALDRRFKLDYLTIKAKELIFRTLYKLAVRTGVSKRMINEYLSQEFASYCRLEGMYSRKAAPQENAYEWWGKMRDNGVLRKLARRLANMKSSTANCERVFSVLKLIQGPLRTRFSLQSMDALGRTKVNLSDQIDKEYYSVLSKEERIFDSDEMNQTTTERKKKGIHLSTIADRLKKVSLRVTSRFISQPNSPGDRATALKKPALREHLTVFNSLIDFSIINPDRDIDLDEDNYSSGIEDEDNALKKFKQSMSTTQSA